MTKAPSEINQNIPKGLEQIIGIAMEKNPLHRYQSAEDMLRHLRRLKENPGIIFKIPKKREEGEQKSIMSMLSGGGPMFPIIAGVALAFFTVFAIGAAYVLGQVSNAMTQTVETIEVDQFEGRMYDEAMRVALENSDKYTAQIVYEYSDEYEVGYIIKQSPSAGASKKIKVDLTLTVCSGNKEIVMPSLTDYNYKAAIKELRNIGLEYTIEYQKDDVRTSGQVLATSPAAGEKTTVGSSVILYVCDGFAEGDIEVPDFTDMTEKEAFKEIIKLDLAIGSVTYVKDEADRGTVIAQSIEEDTKVVKHTRIGLTVSGGPDFDPDNPDETAEEETTAPETTAKAETTAPQTTKAETTAKPETTAPETTAETTGEETTGENDPGETNAPEKDTEKPKDTEDTTKGPDDKDKQS